MESVLKSRKYVFLKEKKQQTNKPIANGFRALAVGALQKYTVYFIFFTFYVTITNFTVATLVQSVVLVNTKEFTHLFWSVVYRK